MTLTLDQIPCPDSLLRRVDPRWKLAALLIAVIVSAFLRSLPVSGAALAGALVLASFGRLPPRWLLARLGTLVVLLALFALPLPLLMGDDGPRWEIGPLHLSQLGLALALLIGTKALTIVTLMLVILGTSPLDATLKAAHSLRMPGLLVQLAMLSYRQVFLVADELARMRVALRVRGFRNRASRHSYRTIGHVAGTLLVRSFERSELVGQAMRCRAFDGRFRSLAEFMTRPSDVIAFVLITAGSLALLAWDTVWF